MTHPLQVPSRCTSSVTSMAVRFGGVSQPRPHRSTGILDGGRLSAELEPATPPGDSPDTVFSTFARTVGSVPTARHASPSIPEPSPTELDDFDRPRPGPGALTGGQDDCAARQPVVEVLGSCQGPRRSRKSQGSQGHGKDFAASLDFSGREECPSSHDNDTGRQAGIGRTAQAGGGLPERAPRQGSHSRGDCSRLGRPVHRCDWQRTRDAGRSGRCRAQRHTPESIPGH